MVKRFGGDTLVVGGLLLLFAALTYYIAAATPEGSERRPRRTSYSVKSGGLKAAYLLLLRRGLDVRRCEKPPADWPKDARVMITATPYMNLMGETMWNEGAADKALQWVEAGGVLLILCDSDTTLTDRLSLNLPRLKGKDATFSPQQPATSLAGVGAVHFPGPERWEKAPAASVVLLGDQHPAVVTLARGSGRILAVATPAIIDNHTLADADNARFLAQIVEANLPAGGRVYFDEFHQGYSESDTLWGAIGKPGQFASLQLLAVALLLVYSAGRRFGLPRPLPPQARVSSEYVASLSDLFRRARATDAALESVYQSFWRDLCRAVGLPLDAAEEEVTRRAAVLADDNPAAWRDRLGALVRECRTQIAAGPGAIRGDALLRLVREIEAVRKELKLGGDGA